MKKALLLAVALASFSAVSANAQQLDARGFPQSSRPLKTVPCALPGGCAQYNVGSPHARRQVPNVRMPGTVQNMNGRQVYIMTPQQRRAGMHRQGYGQQNQTVYRSTGVQAPGPATVTIPTPGPQGCDPGFQSVGTRCIRLNEKPELAEYERGKRICTPGQTREVPIEGRPGEFKIQTCGNIARRGDQPAAAPQQEEPQVREEPAAPPQTRPVKPVGQQI